MLCISFMQSAALIFIMSQLQFAICGASGTQTRRGLIDGGRGP